MYTYIYMCVCVYVTYVYTYTHMYIYIYTHRGFPGDELVFRVQRLGCLTMNHMQGNSSFTQDAKSFRH